MRLYQITPTANDYYTLNTVKETAQGRARLLRGKSIKNTWETPEVGVVADGKPGDFLSYGSKIACTEKAYQLLRPFIGEAIEFLPAIHKKSETKFYLLNVLDSATLDMENATVEKIPTGLIMKVVKFAYKESAIVEKMIFNVSECFHEGPLVSEEFKAFIEKHKLEGLTFKKVY